MRNSTLYYSPIFTIGLFYFALVIWVLPQRSFYTPDSGVKFIQLKEMIRQGVMNPTIEYPGSIVDQSLKFVPFYPWLVDIDGNKIYSQFPALFPWLSSFFYQEMGLIGLYIIPALSGFLSLIVMYHLARYFFNDGLSLFSTVLLGLGTPLFFYSLVFWEHALSFFVSILILLTAIKIIEGKRGLLILLPPLILICMWIRSESIVFTFSILLAGSILIWKDIRKYRNILLVACAALLLVTGAFIAFNLITSGTFFGPHISKHLLNYYMINLILTPGLKRFQIINNLLARSDLGPGLQRSAILIMAAFLVLLSAIFLLRKKVRLPNDKLVNLALYSCITVIIFTAVISIFKQRSLIGLFQVTPFVIFSLFSFLEDCDDIFLRFIKLLASIYFAFALLMPAKGGMQWGPRYILYLYPLLIILCWKALPIIKKRFSKPMSTFLQGSFFLLLMFSFIIQSKGIIKLYSIKNRQLQISAVVETEPTGVIISGFENFLVTYSPEIYNKKMFFYSDHARVEELIEKLFQKDVRSFSINPFPSFNTNIGINTSKISNLRLSDTEKVYFVEDRYVDQNNKKGLVFKVFEIR